MDGKIINIDREILGGTPAFFDTGVPIKNFCIQEPDAGWKVFQKILKELKNKSLKFQKCHRI